MLAFQGISKSSTGQLYVIGLAVGTAIPAGAVVTNGLAKSTDGYLYVVFA